ncbi:hypothetical protein [Geodermatophilus sp. SYSU D00710]
MSETAPEETVPLSVPDAMPVLSRGRHRNSSHGACFMEYTALLAGERFSDEPRCVDGELATVLRGANDRLSDADRPVLLPLLGRAIGLAVEPPPPEPRWSRRVSRRYHREVAAPHQTRVARLHREVTRRFVAALGPVSPPVTRDWTGRSGELAWVFWETMTEPTVLSRSPDHVRRLVSRLHLLHECYEQALEHLGYSRTPRSARATAGSAVEA